MYQLSDEAEDKIKRLLNISSLPPSVRMPIEFQVSRFLKRINRKDNQSPSEKVKLLRSSKNALQKAINLFEQASSSENDKWFWRF
jgi:hypothetical protein